ncbi:Uma2 family endonuclease [Streptomyces sp. NPDC051940]|uniref:Uma2 family endonuclease n=1 Tax=Streptomyces sp. NPDC051940 TaxID=3155675 RepID=UPI00342F6D60
MALTIPEHEVRMAATDPVEDAFFAASAAVPRGWRVELIEGQLHVVPPANGEHEVLLSELNGQIRDHHKDLVRLQGVGLRLPGAAPHDCVIPDLVIAPNGSFVDDQEWHDPAPVLLVAEVTSKSTARNDRERKLYSYARAGIPVYVLVDREAGAVWVHSAPEDGEYTSAVKAKMTGPFTLPEPFGFEVDLSEV